MKGFFAGVLFAAPLTALIMWFVSGYMGTIDTKVERDTVSSKLDAAIFAQDFDKRWGEMGGDPATCSSTGANIISELRKQLGGLQQELAEERQADKQKASSLDQIINTEGKKDEQH